MELTPMQKDVLTEVINIGFGRAASTLSTLTGKRVVLQVPEISLLSTEEMETILGTDDNSEVTTIQQIFTGKVTGSALLVLNQDSASILVDLVSGGTGEKRRLMASDREALEEIGNILLNAYVGSFGNILNINLRFLVPRIQNQNFASVLDSLAVDQAIPSSVLLVKTEFFVGQGQISGYVIVIMGIESLETLIKAMDEMAG